MKNYMKTNKYEWTFLFFNNQYDLLKDYKVKAYPTFYLVDPDGKMSLLPAVPPSEPFFEKRFNDAYSTWQKEHARRLENEKGLGNK